MKCGDCGFRIEGFRIDEGQSPVRYTAVGEFPGLGNLVALLQETFPAWENVLKCYDKLSRTSLMVKKVEPAVTWRQPSLMSCSFLYLKPNLNAHHMATSGKPELEILSFKTPAEFEQWLSLNHASSKGIWLRFYKKGSGVETVTYLEALHEALCYGWIDGQTNKYDEQSWLQRFTPRGPRSIWSKRNTGFIATLESTGKMKPSGIAEVEKAKTDGRWEKAYDSPANSTVPEDFMKALSKNKKALAFFEALNKTNKYAIIFRLQTAKKPETREKRMKEILEMLKKGEKFH